jgi:hypothetical protein
MDCYPGKYLCYYYSELAIYNKKNNKIIIVNKINLLRIVQIIKKYKLFQWKHHKNQLEYNQLQYKIIIIK